MVSALRPPCFQAFLKPYSIACSALTNSIVVLVFDAFDFNVHTIADVIAIPTTRS